MAKLKMLKAPKKPKGNASAATMENYLRKVADTKKINTQRAQENAKTERLKKAISGIKPSDVLPGGRSVGGVKKRRTTKKAAPKKAAKKTAKRRR
jgi:hypothetical protein